MRPLSGYTHSFHNSGQRCTMVPPACEGRSFLMEISHGEPLRREIMSENHTRPGQYGATRSRLTSSQHSRQNSREQSEASASSVPWHPAPVEPNESQSTRGDIAMPPESQRGPPEPGQTPSKYASLPLCEASFPGPRPLPRQDVCSHIEMPRDVNCSQREEFVPGPHKVLVHQPVQGAPPWWLI